MSYQQQGYYQVPPQDIEANKPPPYTSTYVYGEQPQTTPQGVPPSGVYDEEQNLFPNDDAGISLFSEKSVRQGKLAAFINYRFCCLIFYIVFLFNFIFKFIFYDI